MPEIKNNRSVTNGLGFWTILGLILITLKLCNVIEWSWWVVWLPIYGWWVVSVILAVLYIISRKW